jgi:hypothetical protein
MLLAWICWCLPYVSFFVYVFKKVLASAQEIWDGVSN